MIRFCDKEVCCVGEELNRQDLVAYFLNGHRQEIICIIDNQGKYRGKITYDSLLGKDLEASINREYWLRSGSSNASVAKAKKVVKCCIER